MDQGLSAVLGALVGASSALGAAWVTARTQMNSARIAAKAEHQRQRRESRLSAYKEFINAYDEFQQTTIPVLFMSGPSREFFNRALENSVGESLLRIKAAWLDVALAGPKEVSRKADALLSVARVALARVHEICAIYSEDPDYDEGALQGFWESLSEIYNTGSIRDFTVAAQAVLDDDGSQLPGHRSS
ncbi:hypothetical protein ACIQVL_05705 [Streptomyces sp. NPDC090499]|uniref:hypothetical protein n=1 Tax=Streptomyces sp. NPDC090499 TaxID=3365965 RepID=UPI0037F4BF00